MLLFKQVRRARHAEAAYLWLTGLALVVGALVLTDALRWRPGLAADKVCAIWASPTRPSWAVPVEMPADYHAYCWQRVRHNRRDAVVVRFFADGPVMAAVGGRRARPGPLARLRAWLGW